MGGSPVRLRVDCDDFVCRRVFLHGFFEPAATAFVLEALPRDGVFCDVGANFGYFTLLARGVAGHRGPLAAFEPSPSCLARLRENLDLNGFADVAVLDCAVSDSEGTAELFEMADDAENRGIASLLPFARDAAARTVQTRRLDDWRREAGHARVDLAKIDIEGAEVAAFRGMREGIAEGAWRVILLELHPRRIREWGESPGEIDALLRAAGYRIYRLATRTPNRLATYTLKNRYRLEPCADMGSIDAVTTHVVAVAPGARAPGEPA